MAFSVAVATRNVQINAATATINSGKLKIYSGSVPANADAALGGATLLATLTLNATAFASASSGSATANSISSVAAGASGTASFFRITKSDDTVVAQGSITATGGGGDITLDSTTVTTGDTIAVSSAPAWSL